MQSNLQLFGTQNGNVCFVVIVFHRFARSFFGIRLVNNFFSSKILFTIQRLYFAPTKNVYDVYVEYNTYIIDSTLFFFIISLRYIFRRFATIFVTKIQRNLFRAYLRYEQAVKNVMATTNKYYTQKCIREFV